MSEQEIIQELRVLSQKVDRLSSFLESMRAENFMNSGSLGTNWGFRVAWIRLRWRTCVALPTQTI
jgi:hypothetical protein